MVKKTAVIILSLCALMLSSCGENQAQSATEPENYSDLAGDALYGAPDGETSALGVLKNVWSLYSQNGTDMEIIGGSLKIGGTPASYDLSDADAANRELLLGGDALSLAGEAAVFFGTSGSFEVTAAAVIADSSQNARRLSESITELWRSRAENDEASELFCCVYENAVVYFFGDRQPCEELLACFEGAYPNAQRQSES